MDTNSQVTIRTKKLGILIRDARLAARRSVEECAEAMGIRKILFCAYEEGFRAPSLPELETLVFFLDPNKMKPILAAIAPQVCWVAPAWR